MIHFWISVFFPFLVFGTLSLRRQDNGAENSFFSRQQWGLVDCIAFYSMVSVFYILDRTFSFRLFEVMFRGPAQMYLRWGGILRNLFVLAIFIIYVKCRLKNPLSDLGLHARSLSENIYYGLISILPWTLISTILGLLISIDFDSSTTEINHDGLGQGLQFIQTEGQSMSFLIVLISSIVLGPLREELIYRGFFYGPIRRKVSRNAAILLSSSIFTVVHISEARLFPLVPFLLGCLFAYLYEKRQSLIPGITAHSFWNLIVYLRRSYIHNNLFFAPPGHLVGFLFSLLVVQLILLLIVYLLYQEIVGSSKESRI